MKILFFMLHPGYMRYYYTTIQELLQRGHDVHLSFDIPSKQAKDKLDSKLAEQFPTQVTISKTPKFTSKYYNLSRAVSWGMDYLRYLTPAFKNADRLRKRVEVKIHPKFKKLFNENPFLRSQKVIHASIKFFCSFYAYIPVSSALKRFMKTLHPDIVLVTPLITQGSFQGEYLKAARLLKIPSGYCVASWDNLTSKGLIRGNPNKIFLWNEFQKKEAQELHFVKPSRIEYTGAQNFDTWFQRTPSRSRKAFCRNAQLDLEKPFLLYLCSSNFMAPNETRFITNWINSLRNCADPQLAELGILIRPYPEHVKQWEQVDLSQFENVSLWPPAGEYPLTEESIANFYDSIYHSKAVVGINTSAMIESAIIGRPVLTITASELNKSQSDTIHFHYLLKENGGFLLVSKTLDQHITQLQTIIRGDTSINDAIENFVNTFIRPGNLEKDRVPLLADEIEKLNDIKPSHSLLLNILMTINKVLYYPFAYLVTRVSVGKKWKHRAGQWKKVSRLAEELGVDPLELWDVSERNNLISKDINKNKSRLIELMDMDKVLL